MSVSIKHMHAFEVTTHAGFLLLEVFKQFGPVHQVSFRELLTLAECARSLYAGKNNILVHVDRW